MTSPPLARQAAQYACGLASADLPVEVRTKASLCLLDFLSCCMAASAPSLVAYLQQQGSGREEAWQWGLGKRIAAIDAAFGNATLGHSLIREDMHVASGNHIGVMVVPAMLALAERERLSGRALVRGIVAGYEMTARLGMAVRTGLRNRHFRPSGISGAFGVAAGAIAALHLDEESAVHALAFAANFSCGLNEWAWAGGQEIYVHAGMAARNGLLAADLARAGMRASETILEGPDGMFAAYGSSSTAPGVFAESLGAGHLILGVGHKPFAGCNFIQTPIAAALTVRDKLQGRLPEDIEHIVVRTFPAAKAYPGCDYRGPFANVQQSKMSLQYGVAAALLFGRVDEQAYQVLAEPRLNELVSRCHIELDERYSNAYPAHQPVTVHVRTRANETVEASCDDVPWLSGDAVIERFRGAGLRLLSEPRIDSIVEAASGLWDIPRAIDLTSLFG